MLLSFLFALPALAAKDLNIAADYWPPFTSEQEGQRIAADLVEKALRKAGFIPKTKIVAWKQVIAGVKTQRFDAIIGAWKNKDREAYLQFSEPYLENRIMLIGRKDNAFNFENINQLTNKKVAIVAGYAYGPELTDNTVFKKVTGKSDSENIKKLVAKKVDFMLADAIVAKAMQEHLPAEIKDNLVVYDKIVTFQQLYFAVRKDHPRVTDIINQFNAAISQLIADGSYNKILGISWILADTNNDGIYEYIAGDNISSSAGDPEQNHSGYQVMSPINPDNESLAKKPLLQYF